MANVRPELAELGTGTIKIPPYRSPTNEKSYPFKKYLKDLQLWTMATDIQPPRVVPAIVMRLGGTARELFEDAGEMISIGGAFHPPDGGAPRHVDGAAYVVMALRARFGQLNQENSIEAITEFMSFDRKPGEKIDDCMARIETCRIRAVVQGGIGFNVTIVSWLLLTRFHIPPDKWTIILIPTNGMLPASDRDFFQFQDYRRRHGHMYEARHDIARAQKTGNFWQTESETRHYNESYQHPIANNGYLANNPNGFYDEQCSAPLPEQVWLSQIITSDLERDEHYDEHGVIPDESMFADICTA